MHISRGSRATCTSQLGTSQIKIPQMHALRFVQRTASFSTFIQKHYTVARIQSLSSNCGALPLKVASELREVLKEVRRTTVGKGRSTRQTRTADPSYPHRHPPCSVCAQAYIHICQHAYAATHMSRHVQGTRTRPSLRPAAACGQVILPCCESSRRHSPSPTVQVVHHFFQPGRPACRPLQGTTTWVTCTPGSGQPMRCIHPGVPRNRMN